MPTLHCNCRCSYCYIPPEEKTKKEKSRDFRQVLEQFINDFPEDTGEVPQLRFIGGEPYLEIELLHELTALFFKAFPEGLAVINTNGTLITSQNIQPFSVFGKRLVHIISLDGPEEVHNKRRTLLNKENSWQTASDSIKILQHTGLPVFCNMVLDEESFPPLEQFFDYLLHELNMKDISISFVSRESDPLSKETKFELLEGVYKTATKYDMNISGHHRLLLAGRISELECRAGQKTALVTPEMQVFSCQRFVGRADAPYWKNGTPLDTLTDKTQVKSCCYNPDTEWLGEKLYVMYRELYPQYVQISELDRILFGVI